MPVAPAEGAPDGGRAPDDRPADGCAAADDGAVLPAVGVGCAHAGPDDDGPAKGAAEPLGADRPVAVSVNASAAETARTLTAITRTGSRRADGAEGGSTPRSCPVRATSPS
jgi:hypothetical protein